MKRDEYQKVNLRRNFLLVDATKQFNRESFDVTKLLRVSFIGESEEVQEGNFSDFYRLLYFLLPTFLKVILHL